MSESPHEEPSAIAVASYLRRHPGFLAEHPDLALLLQVPRDEGSATSLASYQLEILRDKNRELNRRLQELFANAQENERLTVRTHQLCLALMRARDAAGTVRSMVASLREDFGSEQVRLVLYAPLAGLEATDWLRIIPASDARMAAFRDFVAAGEPLCGRLQQDKLDLLFDDAAATAQSAALMSLFGYGLLAIGSQDANRFYPGMGTLFLRLMADALTAALDRFSD